MSNEILNKHLKKENYFSNHVKTNLYTNDLLSISTKFVAESNGLKNCSEIKNEELTRNISFRERASTFSENSNNSSKRCKIACNSSKIKNKSAKENSIKLQKEDGQNGIVQIEDAGINEFRTIIKNFFLSKQS